MSPTSNREVEMDGYTDTKSGRVFVESNGDSFVNTMTRQEGDDEVRQQGTESEELFYAQLGRGASVMLQFSSNNLDQFVMQDYEAQREGSEDKARDARVEAQISADFAASEGKAKEEEQGGEEQGKDKAKEGEGEEEDGHGMGKDEERRREEEKAEQMRSDEEMARQLQIQFLREGVGADEELLRQLNSLVQNEAVLPSSHAQNEELVECAICCDEKGPQQIYTYYQCSHRYCVDCLKEYYATHIKEGNVKLRCPYPNCPTTVLPVQVEAVVDVPLLQKYKQFAWFDEVKHNPNTRWCTKPGCETVLVRQSDSEQKVVCSGCETVTCFLCGDEWHESISCQENKDHKVKLGLADTTVEDYAKKNVEVRICPRCAVPIEKNKGCNTMTCSFCGCAFCWLCGELMTPNHFSQKGPCKGKDGEAKWVKATVYTIIALMVLTLPVWAGPAYAVYKIKQRRKNRSARSQSAGKSDI